MKLHLGVADVPYSSAPRAPGAPPTTGKETTGDVAGWLETKYHVMETFWNQKGDEAGEKLAEGLQGAVESLIMGAPPQHNPYGTGTQEIEDLFRRFLSEADIEKLGVPGVPTKAALDRRSARFKKGKGPNRRPSFIDTGLYQSNFRSWVD